MESHTLVSLDFPVSRVSARRGWLRYFAVAVGLGMSMADAQEIPILNYWFVYGDKLPEANENAARVIRVTGEKGEKFENVWLGDLRDDPALRQARSSRERLLRTEAAELAKLYIEDGDAPTLAYEKAWAVVYRRHWLSADWHHGSSQLDKLLDRILEMDDAHSLSDEEVRWAMEALMEDDHRLDTRHGRELLMRLAISLRAHGFGKLGMGGGVNDELMEHFVDAMQHGYDSMSAYRDALFKINRDRVMRHSLVGYYAPIGAGFRGRAAYRQAPVRHSSSVGTGNTQPAGIELTDITSAAPQTDQTPDSTPELTPDFTAGMDKSAGDITHFLPKAPESDEIKKDEEKADEDDILKEEEETATASESPEPRMLMMRSFSMRSMASAPQQTTQKSGLDSGSASGTLTWNSVSGQSAVWDNGQTAVWSDGSGTDVTYADTAHVVFGAGDDLNKNVQIAEGGVVADSVSVTGGSYLFSCDKLTVLTVKEALTVENDGVLGLDSKVTLNIGANRITGGQLENVKMVVTGEISRPITGDSVTVHNLITSADGNTTGILTNVNLHAGTSTEYATLHNVAFDGESTLSGYVTFEKTQAPGTIRVVDGATLTLENLTFDLRGLAMDEKNSLSLKRVARCWAGMWIMCSRKMCTLYTAA